MYEIILFIVVIGILIFVHELGHFWVAKRAGIRVDEFSLGFPPRIFSITRGGTKYSLGMIPFGGYVKIFGEDGEEKNQSDSYGSKGKITRARVIAAGVVMNWLFAALLVSIGMYIGLPQVIDETTKGDVFDKKVQISGIALDSPAEQEGIKIGDSIQKIQFEKDVIDVVNVEEVQKFVGEHKGKEIILSVVRGKEILEKKVLAREAPPEGQGSLGVELANTGRVAYSWYEAPIKGIEWTASMTLLFLKAFYGLFSTLITSGKLLGDVAGPVGIAALTLQFSELGFVYLMQFVAVLSLNLAIINLLPLPALDGGRLLFLAIEAIKGSPVNQRVEKIVHSVGLALLLTLMVLITFRDISRLF